MIKDFGNGKLPRYKAGSPLLSDNDTCVSIKSVAPLFTFISVFVSDAIVSGTISSVPFTSSVAPANEPNFNVPLVFEIPYAEKSVNILIRKNNLGSRKSYLVEKSLSKIGKVQWLTLFYSKRSKVLWILRFDKGISNTLRIFETKILTRASFV